MNDPDKLPSSDASPSRGHENTDANPAALSWFALGLVLMVACVLIGLQWMHRQFEVMARRSDPASSPLAVDQIPPQPRLQVDPASDLKRFRDGEESRLSSCGWIGVDRKLVHIPIRLAMELLAQRGIPEPDGPVVPEQKEAER